MAQELDAALRVHSPGHQFFKLGVVFRVLWPESAGQRVSDGHPSTATHPRFPNEKILVRIRWFVVIREGLNYCTCLSIQTYQGRGVMHPRVKSHHAIIFTGNQPPMPLDYELPQQPSEQPMGNPIRVIPHKPWEQLDPTSRINFMKLYTIEHNVKVSLFGHVAEESTASLISQWSKLWLSPATDQSPRYGSAEYAPSRNLDKKQTVFEPSVIQTPESIVNGSAATNIFPLQVPKDTNIEKIAPLNPGSAMFNLRSQDEDLDFSQPEGKETQENFRTFSTFQENNRGGDDDHRSEVSSYAGSVFSLPSVASTATDLAKDGGYSANDIATATAKLLALVHHEADLAPLYLNAVHDPTIGPQRLQRNLRRIFKQYGENLKVEAKDQLEFLASRLVTLKAGFLSQAIVTSYNGNTSIPEIGLLLPTPDQVWDEENDEDEETSIGADGRDEEVNIEAAEIGDLVTFRNFLIRSNAFAIMCTQVRNFVLPKPSKIEEPAIVPSKDGTEVHLEEDDTRNEEINTPPRQGNETDAYLKKESTGIEEIRAALVKGSEAETHPEQSDGGLEDLNTPPVKEEKPTEVRSKIDGTVLEEIHVAPIHESETEARLGLKNHNLKKHETENIQGRMIQMFETLLITAGYLEPPLKPGMVRLRWQCRCGEDFTSDVKEYETNGISELITLIEKLTGSRVTSTPYSPNSTNQRYNYQRPALWLHRVLGWFANMFQRPSHQGTLPQYGPNTAAIHLANGSAPQQQDVRLLVCMYDSTYGEKLQQDCITTIDTDRKLFDFLRQQFTRSRGNLGTKLLMKQVKGIHFNKLNLFMSGSVEVRHHELCCESMCECIPPQSHVEPTPNAQYRCTPAGPLKAGPPIVAKKLAHYFAKPWCIDHTDDSIYNRLPKLIGDELQGKKGQPAEGWGIYFEEGLDGDLLALTIIILFFGGSLMFAILWTCLRMDIQGAFGVSAYLITAAGVLVSVVAIKASKI